jgi:hypothetical protein
MNSLTCRSASGPLIDRPPEGCEPLIRAGLLGCCHQPPESPSGWINTSGQRQRPEVSESWSPQSPWWLRMTDAVACRNSGREGGTGRGGPRHISQVQAETYMALGALAEVLANWSINLPGSFSTIPSRQQLHRPWASSSMPCAIEQHELAVQLGLAGH